MTRPFPQFIDVGALDDIPVQGARKVKTPAGCVGLFRTAAGQVHALSNACPHKGGPLTEGIIHDGFVTCPLHNLVLSLSTGEAQGPDAGRVTVYPVKVVDGRVLLSITASADLVA